MACLLGICDSKISTHSIESQQTNKIGGIPVLFNNIHTYFVEPFLHYCIRFRMDLISDKGLTPLYVLQLYTL